MRDRLTQTPRTLAYLKRRRIRCQERILDVCGSLQASGFENPKFQNMKTYEEQIPSEILHPVRTNVLKTILTSPCDCITILKPNPLKSTTNLRSNLLHQYLKTPYPPYYCPNQTLMNGYCCFTCCYTFKWGWCFLINWSLNHYKKNHCTSFLDVGIKM